MSEWKDGWLGDAGALARARIRRPGAAPSFLVVGARRAGTTSLYQSIIAHPKVEPCRTAKGTHYFDVHHHRGRHWFRSSFPAVEPPKITGEASPYYMFHPLAPERIAEELPHVRLIALLRDPVSRAWSHYQFSRRRGFEDLPFDEAIDSEADRLTGEEDQLRRNPRYAAPHLRHHSYLARGRYAEQLERLYRHVPAERVLVLQYEALTADPHPLLDRVFEFLGLPSYDVPDFPHHKRQTYDAIPEPAARQLQDLFREPNERLYAMPGITFRWDLAAPADPVPARDGGAEA